MKQCTKCSEVLSLDKFSKKGSGYHSSCKDCHNTYVRERRYPNNRQKQISSSAGRKKDNPIKVLKNRYSKLGVNTEGLEDMVLECSGACSICGEKGKLVLDHCHETNVIRGMLCSQCNVGLGMFKDDIDTLAKAISYLTR